VIPIRDANPTRRTPWITLTLIAANVLVFLAWQPTFGDPGDPRFVGGLRVSAIGFTPAPPPPPRGFPVLEVTFALVGIAGGAAVWLNVKLSGEAKRREEMPPEEEFE